MTKNLRIKDMELTSEDSDIDSTFSLPNSEHFADNYNDSCSRNLHSMYDKAMVFEFDNGSIGYNYFAATAGSLLTSGNATTSICPKSWKLPSRSDFEMLEKQYKNDSEFLVAPANFGEYGGFFECIVSPNSHVYRTSSAISQTYAHECWANNSGCSFLDSGRNRWKGDSESVRCVAE